MNLYTDKHKKDYRFKIKINIVILSIISLFFILLTTLGLIFLNEDNKLTLEVIIITFDILFLFAVIYISTDKLFNAVIYYKHIKTMLSQNRELIKGTIVSINKNLITLGNLTKSHQVNFKLDSGSEIKLYLNNLFDINLLKINQHYAFNVTSNYIVEIVNEK